MKIIICGAGVVGTGIARQLVLEDHDVVVVDNDPIMIGRLNETLDVTGIVGYASHPGVLQNCGAKDADMLIAVTQVDEVNMVACQIAHTLFNIPTTIARIRDQNYLLPEWRSLYRHDRLPIDYIISPELEVAHTVINRLHAPGVMDTLNFFDNQIRVIELRAESGCPFHGLSFGRIREDLKPHRSRVLAVERNGDILFPDSVEELAAGDLVFFMAPARAVEHVMAQFGHAEKEARRVIIVGAGNIGLFLSQRLEQEEDLSIKLIEISRECATYAANKLEDVTVICGDALDQEILKEVNIADAETFIAVTNDDEVNILSSLLAKRFGCRRAITLINSVAYSPLIGSLGIDVVINPREITVSSILQYIRRGKVRAARAIFSGEVEIIEIEVPAGAPVVGQMLADLDLPRDIFIAAIARDNDIFLPYDEEFALREHDTVLVVCRSNAVKKVDKIFSSQGDYF